MSNGTAVPLDNQVAWNLPMTLPPASTFLLSALSVGAVLWSGLLLAGWCLGCTDDVEEHDEDAGANKDRSA